MKVYRPQQKIIVMVQPGVDYPHNTAYVDGEGTPIMFPVQFVDNEATVESPIGLYMIEKELAFRSLSDARDSVPRIQVAHA